MIFSVPLYWKKLNINYEVGKSTAAVSICRPEINTLAWSGHKLREGGVGKVWTCKKDLSKNKEISVFFLYSFLFLFPSFFVIHQRLNIVAILLTVCTTCSGFLWLRLLYFFVLFVLFKSSHYASSLIHGLFIMWMGKIMTCFFFFKRGSHCTSRPRYYAESSACAHIERRLDPNDV